jgi:glucosamine-6-phosphate isomerase
MKVFKKQDNLLNSSRIFITFRTNPASLIMKVIRQKNYQVLSDFMANEIVNAIKENPYIVLCMASGDTPKLTCELLVKKLKDENMDYSKIRFIGLDEWVGLPPTNTGSCHYFFQKKMIEPLQLTHHQYFLFDGLSKNTEMQCAMMDRAITDSGIDIMVVGIGMNGHIGFNEPGTPFINQCHVIDLDESTKAVGQKYFKEAVELSKGITIGLAHVMNTKKVYLIANGAKKAEVIKKAVEGPVSDNFPASIMQKHKHGLIVVDEEAGSLLSKD